MFGFNRFKPDTETDKGLAYNETNELSGYGIMRGGSGKRRLVAGENDTVICHCNGTAFRVKECISLVTKELERQELRGEFRNAEYLAAMGDTRPAPSGADALKEHQLNRAMLFCSRLGEEHIIKTARLRTVVRFK